MCHKIKIHIGSCLLYYLDPPRENFPIIQQTKKMDWNNMVDIEDLYLNKTSWMTLLVSFFTGEFFYKYDINRIYTICEGYIVSLPV